MIQTNKRITDGLYKRLRIAGVDVWIEDGVLLSSGDSQAQQIIDAYTVADFIAERQRECLAIAKALRDRVVAAVSAGEMASWAVKRAEAQAWTATQDPDQAPLLQLEAAARGVSLADIATRVLGNAAAYAQLEAAISGRCGAHRDALSACASFDEVAAYDLNAGWPAV